MNATINTLTAMSRNPYVPNPYRYANHSPPVFVEEAWFTRWNGWGAGALGAVSNFLLIYFILCRTPSSCRHLSKVLLICGVSDTFYLVMDMLVVMRHKINDRLFIWSVTGPAAHFGYSIQCWFLSVYFASILLSTAVLPVQYYYRYRLVLRNPLSRRQVIFLLCAPTALLFVHMTIGHYVMMYSGEVREGYDYGQLWYSETPIPTLIIGNPSHPMFTAYFTVIGFTFIFSHSFVITFIIKTIRLMRRVNQHTRSERTRQLRGQFEKALGVQTLVPIFVCGMPVIVAIIFVALKMDSGLVGPILPIALSWVPALNPLCTIFFVTPYRAIVVRFVKGLFLGQKASPIMPVTQAENSAYSLTTEWAKKSERKTQRLSVE